MHQASSALIALLANNSQFFMADLLTITPVSGAPIRLTNGDQSLTVGGNLFSTGSPGFTRGRTKTAVGVDVDTMDLTILPAPTDTLGGAPWPHAVSAGVLDGARVTVERVFMPTYGDTSAGTVILFSGRVSTAKPSRNTVALSVKSDLELLNINMPRNVYTPGCLHTLFDAGCALLRSAYQVTGTILSGTTAGLLSTTVTQTTGYYNLGVLTMTSGAAAGLQGTVKAFTNLGASSAIALVRPFPVVPAAGDTFTLVPGCDKTQATCSAKFGNLSHFRGYPYIPQPEKAR